jgi:hypothetical protein
MTTSVRHPSRDSWGDFDWDNPSHCLPRYGPLPRHIVGAGVEIVIIQQPDDDL